MAFVKYFWIKTVRGVAVQAGKRAVLFAQMLPEGFILPSILGVLGAYVLESSSIAVMLALVVMGLLG